MQEVSQIAQQTTVDGPMAIPIVLDADSKADISFPGEILYLIYFYVHYHEHRVLQSVGSLSKNEVDNVFEPAGSGEGPALPGGAVARVERCLNELRHLGPVAGFFERFAHKTQETFDDDPSGDGFPRVDVDEARRRVRT